MEDNSFNDYVKEIYNKSIFPSVDSKHKIFLLLNYLRKEEDRNSKEKIQIIDNLKYIFEKNLDSALPIFEVGDNPSLNYIKIILILEIKSVIF